MQITDTSKTEGFKAIAQRQQNAINGFLDVVQAIANCTRDEAAKVYDTYRAGHCLKTDYVGGRMTVKHGGLLDLDIIQRVIAS